jgi:serine/threonine protein kinase
MANMHGFYGSISIDGQSAIKLFRSEHPYLDRLHEVQALRRLCQSPNASEIINKCTLINCMANQDDEPVEPTLEYFNCDGFPLSDVIDFLNNVKNQESTKNIRTALFVATATACIQVITLMFNSRMTHFDIKPDNIMLCQPYGESFASIRVIDFGCWRPYLDDGTIANRRHHGGTHNSEGSNAATDGSPSPLSPMSPISPLQTWVDQSSPFSQQRMQRGWEKKTLNASSTPLHNPSEFSCQTALYTPGMILQSYYDSSVHKQPINPDILEMITNHTLERAGNKWTFKNLDVHPDCYALAITLGQIAGQSSINSDMHEKCIEFISSLLQTKINGPIPILNINIQTMHQQLTRLRIHLKRLQHQQLRIGGGKQTKRGAKTKYKTTLQKHVCKDGIARTVYMKDVPKNKSAPTTYVKRRAKDGTYFYSRVRTNS